MNHGRAGDADASLLATATVAFPDGAGRIGVAVSGGSDSMAMLHLLARVAPARGWQPFAVTVDHRLRPEAWAEAAFVGRACAALGLPHDVLAWEHGVITGNLMDRARRARQALIAGWARGHEIVHVALGHTADDQAETFLMGLARGSGLDGLAGMRHRWEEEGVTFVRPFLGVTRAALRRHLTEQGLAWIDDPSNDDDRFTRVKARRALKALAPTGITVERLSETVRNLSMVQNAVALALSRAFAAIGTVNAGAVVIDRVGFGRLDAELAHRLVVESLRWVSGAEHPPRAAGVDRIRLAIVRKQRATLSGCRIVGTDSTAFIVREPQAVARIACATDALWDGRWRLAGPHAPDLTVRALGAMGLRACKHWRSIGLSRNVLLVTPAVWRGEELIAAPLAGRPDGWGATVAAGFSLSAVSH